ncbi:MAG: cysteine hydrolase [Candidatus Thiodiazotropha endolucinida]|nr:cysteine hydrolase [Candidatus Thiodiazotropha endolucinida]
MSKSALLVIDMLNEYLLPEGLVYCEQCRDIIPNIKACIEFSRINQIPVVYVNTSLNDEKDIMVKKWGLHALEGSKGARVIDELEPEPNDIVVNKKAYNGFSQTDLSEKLDSLGVDNVAITGIHTHVCVLLTAVGAFENGYNVKTLEDCITTGYLPNHETRLRFFTTHVGELINSHDWMSV